MRIVRRMRGLVGTALMWGTVGACLGAAVYVGLVAARMRVWPLNATHWRLLLAMLGVFSGVGATWGAVCGFGFGVAIWRLGRRWSLEQLSARRVTVWGAVAGAAFPVLIFTTAVLMRDAYRPIPMFSTIAFLSAIAGAGCGYALVWMARRAPALPGRGAMLETSQPDLHVETLRPHERDVHDATSPCA